MDWSNVSTILHCKYSYSKCADCEVFRYGGAILTRQLSTGFSSLSFISKGVYELSSVRQVLSALNARLSKHPMLLYQSNELTLFDISEECVSDLLK